jgi:AcrR family transcriptional regulator
VSNLRQSQAVATRQKLIEVARDLFAHDGFGAVTTTGLCEAAGVTRGALYHHFANLTEVMEAVFATVERDLLADVAQALAGLADSRERCLRAGREVLRVVARDQTTLRIVFVEAPIALRWSQWRAVDGGRSLGFIRGLLEAAAHDGQLAAGVDPELAGQLILGAINEAGMYIARTRATDGLERMQAQVELLIRGLLV